MKVDIMKRFDELMQQAKRHGININTKSTTPLEFDSGQPKTPIQKKVSENYEDIVSQESHKAGLTRRQFLATPMGLAAAAMAISSGIGVSLIPTEAKASIFPGGPGDIYNFNCYGYPIIPNTNINDSDFIDPAGKVALVIGGSTGMGRNAAEKLHAKGFTVIGTSRTPKNIHPQPPFPLWELDLALPHSIHKFVKKVKRTFGQVDLLIANAGRFYLGRPLQGSRDAQRLSMETNVDGHITLIQAIRPMMPTEGYARILMTSSLANHAYSTFRIPYPDQSSSNFLNVSSLIHPYNEAKARLTRFGTAIISEQENSGNPALAVGPLNYPQEPTNLSVSIIHPLGVNTLADGGLINDTIFGEEEPFLREVLEIFRSGIAASGIDIGVAGDAFVQMAMVRDEPDAQFSNLMRPYLHAILADLSLDPNTHPIQFFAQLFAMRAMAEEQEITLRSFSTPDFS